MFPMQQSRREWLKTATLSALCPWVRLKERPNDRVLNSKLAAFVEAQDADWAIDDHSSSFNCFNVHFPGFFSTDAYPLCFYTVSLYPDYVELDSRWLSPAEAQRIMWGMQWQQQSRLQADPSKEYDPRIYQITDENPDALLRVVRQTCSRMRDVFSGKSRNSEDVVNQARLDEVVIALVESAAKLGHANLKLSSPFKRAACTFNGWTCDWERFMNEYGGVVTILSKNDCPARAAFELVLHANGATPARVNADEKTYLNVPQEAFDDAVFAAHNAEAKNCFGLSENQRKFRPRTSHVHPTAYSS